MTGAAEGAIAAFRARVRGCLLGGALGDALGAPLEFLRLDEIRRQHGAASPADLGEAYGVRGAITDDTQLTLFTAEGLIRARVGAEIGDSVRPASAVWHAYLRWLHTQGVPWRRAAGAFFREEKPEPDGWLVGERFLHARRAPANTVVEALRAGEMGTLERPLNDSRGSGGVTRTAAAGLCPAERGGWWPNAEPAPGEIFRLGATLAALTHGHPGAHHAAGAFAATLHLLLHGQPLARALDGAERELACHRGHGGTLRKLHEARELAARGLPSPERLELLGAGWIGAEALALGVACALAAPDFESGVRAAVFHSGDSDSTGAICGGLLGGLLGEAALPPRWLAVLEGRATIARLADDWVDEVCRLRPRSGYRFEVQRGDGRIEQIAAADERGFEEWRARYPGW